MNAIQNLWRGLNLRERAILFFVVLLGVGAVYYQFEYEVQKKKLQAVQTQIDELEPELATYRQALTLVQPQEVAIKLRQAEGEIIQLQDEIEFFKSRMAGQTRDVIRVLRRHAERHGIQLGSVEADEKMVVKGKAAYRQVEIHLQMASKYPAIRQFIAALDSVPAIIAIQKFQVTRQPELLPRVQTTMTLRLFVL